MSLFSASLARANPWPSHDTHSETGSHGRRNCAWPLQRSAYTGGHYRSLACVPIRVSHCDIYSCAITKANTYFSSDSVQTHPRHNLFGDGHVGRPSVVHMYALARRWTRKRVRPYNSSLLVHVRFNLVDLMEPGNRFGNFATRVSGASCHA